MPAEMLWNAESLTTGPIWVAVVGRVADDERVRARFGQRTEEPVGDAVGDDQSRSGGALLAGGAKRAEHHLLERQVDVGVVEDDSGVLAAHLGLHRYPARRRRPPRCAVRCRWIR